jgi:tetraacyldisaccharide-1-P 4'-kinase
LRILEIVIASDALQRFMPGEGDSEAVSFQRIASKEEAQALRWMLVSGIAFPPAFERSVKSLGIQFAGHRIHADHYRYTHRDWVSIVSEARRLSARGILTTEKDFWKLLHAAGPEIRETLRDLPLAVLTLQVSIEKGEESFWRDIEMTLGAV